ncbi:MAG: hypothetical protein J6V42_06650, partial [Clostridia bacterium]|nr:hypothetical protein [Clostridia bacterium]
RIDEKGVAEEMLFDTRVLVTGGEDTALCVEGKEESLVYIGAGVGESDAANELCRAADYLIFGAHGERVQNQVFFEGDARILKSVFYAEREARQYIRIAEGEYSEHFPKETGEARLDIILK